MRKLDLTAMSNESHAMVFPTVGPALSPTVHLGLTITFVVLYSLLFLFIYIQLWMSLYYRNKRLSYRTVFLFLCLVWAALRVTLFSFYFNNCELAEDLDIALYWMLFCLPVCVQFFTLSLMVLFFVQVTYSANRNAYFRCCQWLLVAVGPVIFVTTNIACAVIVRSPAEEWGQVDHSTAVLWRVVINDLLFIIYGVVLSVCLVQVVRHHSTSSVLQTEGVTVCQAVVACVLMLILYTSRAVYNLIAVSKAQINLPDFGYGWLDVSDQADVGDLRRGYLVFGAVLLLWEFLPTLIVVLAFRVSRPQQVPEEVTPLITERARPRTHFFDNPRRYDSDDDLSRSVTARSGVGTEGLYYPHHASSAYAANRSSLGGLRDSGVLGGGSMPYHVSSPPPSLHMPHRISHSLRNFGPLSPRSSRVTRPVIRSSTSAAAVGSSINSPTHLPQEDPGAQFYDGT